MATIATQPQVGYRPGPRWMALFLVAAAGIGAGTVALVQTMTSEGVTAGRTAAVSSVDGATQTRALNQTEASIPYGERLSGLAGDTQAVAAITKALADANRDNAAATSENVAAQRELQNEQLKPAGGMVGLIARGALNETQAAVSPFVQGIIDARALNEVEAAAGSLELARIADARTR